MSKERHGSTRLIGILSAVIGLLLVIGIAIEVNLILSNVDGRVDLTEENLFTLSDGTREIVASLEHDLYVVIPGGIQLGQQIAVLS